MAIGVDFSVRVADIDETPLRDEAAAQMVIRLAEAKARAVARADEEVVLGADTAVVLDGVSYAKPDDEADALGMLAALSGKTHRVLTGVAVLGQGGLDSTLSSTEVCFRDIHPDEARRYWQSGEPRGKAGSYAVQGLGGVFVKSLVGSYTGVVGLPVYETAGLLAKAGIELLPVSRSIE